MGKHKPAQINCVQVLLVHSVSSRDRQYFTFIHRWKDDVTRFKSISTLLSYDVPDLSNYARNNVVHPKLALFWGAEKKQSPIYGKHCAII